MQSCFCAIFYLFYQSAMLVRPVPFVSAAFVSRIPRPATVPEITIHRQMVPIAASPGTVCICTQICGNFIRHADDCRNHHKNAKYPRPSDLFISFCRRTSSFFLLEVKVLVFILITPVSLTYFLYYCYFLLVNQNAYMFHSGIIL